MIVFNFGDLDKYQIDINPTVLEIITDQEL